jgi:hypothetical protein
VALLAGGSQSASLNDPSALDASMANGDNEPDPAVAAIIEAPADAGDAAQASRAPPSASPTPPPEGTLADHVAGLIADGKEAPGVADEDTLLSGEEDGPGGNLNVEALAVEAERSARGTRKKQKATLIKTVKSKEVIPDTESDGEKPVPRKRKRNSEGNGADRAKASARKGKGKKEVVELDESGDDGRPAPNSRHLSVSKSQIYMDWNGPLLDASRRKFQSMMFARDGGMLKSQTPTNNMNYKMVLRAAQAVMPAKEYASFSGQMDRAYQNKEKA